MHHVYVVSSFLHAGVPIAKLTNFRDILEENVVHLTYRRNMNFLGCITQINSCHCIKYIWKTLRLSSQCISLLLLQLQSLVHLSGGIITLLTCHSGQQLLERFCSCNPLRQQPKSVFSLLKAAFTEQQEGCLQD